jgi:hypothetical protein
MCDDLPVNSSERAAFSGRFSVVSRSRRARAREAPQRSPWLWALAALAWLMASPRAALAINQPDGTPIPATMGLQSIFGARGDGVDAMRDAAVTPERFVPGCRLTFTLVSRGPALFRNAFGWYNVTGRAPTEDDLHVLLPCDAAAGAVVTLDLTREPAYRGGEIGFFLRTPEDGDTQRCAGGDCCARTGRAGRTYYSERRFNPDSVESGGTGYVHLLTYDSRSTRDAFYFAWEDLFRGGDNNFTDFVAQVSNLVCSGGGSACDTGMRGVCGQGVQQCRAGRLECVGVTRAGAERCDGLDNDCNGAVDEGEGLCPVGRVCDRGVCVPPCLERECFVGFRCSDRGTCVEDACAMVTCATGQRCEAGRCVGACENIRCPSGQACRAGRCVNACEGVTCDMDQVCSNGACVPRCQCRRCGAGETCATDGRCVATDCATVTCAAGLVCAMGRCVDACEGAVCPRGERCAMGACVADERPDASASGDAAAPTGPDSGAMDASSASDSGLMDASSDARNPRFFDMGGRGCQCRAGVAAGANDANRTNTAASWAIALCTVALSLSRRRKVTSRRASS